MNITSVMYMIIFSIVIGYITMPIILNFDNKYITNNLNKIYMSIFMALFMGLYELYMMHNIAIKNYLYIIITFLIIVFYWLIVKQKYINERQFLLSMIEHHGMAVKMSEKILKKNISDETRELAIQIINSQEKEVEFMTKKLESLK